MQTTAISKFSELPENKKILITRENLASIIEDFGTFDVNRLPSGSTSVGLEQTLIILRKKSFLVRRDRQQIDILISEDWSITIGHNLMK